MDLKQIEKLMTAMRRLSMKKVILKQDGFEIEIERDSTSEANFSSYSTPSVPNKVQEIHHYAEMKETPQGELVTSPMVGTFYLSPSPEDPPFVKIGDSVDEETVLCIIEAMKVMNEVKAGIKGRITEIFVKNGDPVEFGSKIFRVES
ncbi:MAG: acetyl-CoA carboxylase biotin carboxyl carrier protein [Chlamydiales bacterium]